MVSAHQNRLLTEIEGEAPMGQLMRQRCWIPCARSDSLVADGAPKLVRLLGSNYVAFRATDGRVGFFDEACPHRGVSLTLARNEDCALRCIFHAWKFDVSGKAVEVPSEGARSAAFAEKVKLNHYPTFEGGGLLWVFLGQGAPPPRPPLPFLDIPKDNIWVTRNITPCNWLQGVEGTLDSIHVGTLHQSWINDIAGQRGAGTIGLTLSTHPRYEVEHTPYGLRAAALRTIGDGQQYIRITEYVMPFVSLVPTSMTARRGTLFIAVPIDNHSHLMFWGFWDEDAPHDKASERLFRSNDDVGDMDNYVTFQGDKAQAWGQDRAAMAAGHFSGFNDFLLQEDIIVQASMGPIVDRTKEQLCSSDVGLVQARRRLLDELAAMQQGLPTRHQPAGQPVRPVDIVTDEHRSWRDPALV